MGPVWIYVVICVGAQLLFALIGNSAPARFLLSMLGGLVAIVIFQVLAYLDVGYVDPFIWIAVTIQIGMMAPIGCFVFLIVNEIKKMTLFCTRKARHFSFKLRSQACKSLNSNDLDVAIVAQR